MEAFCDHNSRSLSAVSGHLASGAFNLQNVFSRQILPDYIGAKVLDKTKTALVAARKVHSRAGITARIEQFMSEDFEVEKLLSTYGYMKVSSYTPRSGNMFGIGVSENVAAGLDSRDISRMRGQEVSQGDVQTRLYTGRIARGLRTGTRVLLKAYPGRNVGGKDADIMAANELSSHALLQVSDFM
ncbi:hypothetical protein O6H91_18G084500 [Diphasiastrum complanatum]|uniref:Uncharacterized protein n=1 Tax=Diphasiastrum complanatum TaxID=34168 RepID=A0ACC2B3F7_DIPCM|nr:hypothetical protein O6H91_18G084500 [Diphasiastrum complanatum]